jgi:hypothetical protein
MDEGVPTLASDDLTLRDFERLRRAFVATFKRLRAVDRRKHERACEMLVAASESVEDARREYLASCAGKLSPALEAALRRDRRAVNQGRFRS